MDDKMTMNPHVNVDTEWSQYGDRFYPDNGYALWDDAEASNLDENREPQVFSLTINVPKKFSEEKSPHIWAKLIDDTMEVFAKTNPSPQKARAKTAIAAHNAVNGTASSCTYIDENGVEKPKRGVY